MPASQPPQVLFVTSNRIGDCVISSGVIRESARQVPGGEITVVAQPMTTSPHRIWLPH